MITSFKRYLARRRLRLLCEAQAIAYAAYQTAYERGDTRRMHETWPELHRTTTEKLRAEVGFR